MHVDPYIVLGSAVVGFLVGMTGAGGGALMTPMLILLFGIKPSTAISSEMIPGSGKLGSRSRVGCIVEKSSGVRVVFNFSRPSKSARWELRSLKIVVPMPRPDERRLDQP